MKIDLDLNELRGQLLSALGLSPRTSNHAIVIKVKCLLIDGLRQRQDLEIQKRGAVREALKGLAVDLEALRDAKPAYHEDAAGYWGGVDDAIDKVAALRKKP